MKTSRLLLVVMVVVVVTMRMFGEAASRSASSSMHRAEEVEEGRDTAARVRRQTGSSISNAPFYIDVLVVTDYKLFQKWTAGSNSQDFARSKMTQYFTLVMKGVNRIYGTLAPNGMNISVLMSGIYISESSPDSTWTELSLVGNAASGFLVNATKALEKLQTWVRSNSTYSKYDHVVLFTGYNMVSETLRVGETIAGKAYQNQLCAKEGSSLSIVAEIGGFQSVFVAAHELGHSFGAVHDGEVAGCSDGLRYLMAVVTEATQDGSSNPWHFSNCSRASLSSFIQAALLDSSRRSCLTVTSTPGMMLEVEAGQVYSPDDLCRQLMGSQSYYCRSTQLNKNETICTALLCYNPVNPLRCSHFLSPDGTSCGDRKWCRLGVCVQDSLAPPKDSTCVHGDTVFPITSESCSAIVDRTPWRCYESVFKDNCCASCNAKHSRNPACGWGDIQSGCTKQACGRADKFRNISAELCCQTCECTGDSCKCLDRHTDCIGVTHPGKCYNETLAFLCCSTCTRLWIGRQGCEYGDYYTPSECRRAVTGGPVNRDLASLCCATCNTTQSTANGPVHCGFTVAGGSGALVGGVIGGILGLTLIVILVIVLWKVKGRREKAREDNNYSDLHLATRETPRDQAQYDQLQGRQNPNGPHQAQTESYYSGLDLATKVDSRDPVFYEQLGVRQNPTSPSAETGTEGKYDSAVNPGVPIDGSAQSPYSNLAV